MISARATGAYAWLGLGVVAVLSTPAITSADTITLDLDTKFDHQGNPGPSVTGPTAVFNDVGTNQVELTLTFANTDTALKVSGWYFNFLGNLSALDIVQDSGPTINSIDKQSNGYQADGDGSFDIRLAFDNGGPEVFNPGDVAKFTLSGTALNVHSFNAVSATGGGNGTWHGAVHVEGFTTPANYSVWQGEDTPTIQTVVTAVPLPSAFLGGLVLIGVVGAVRARNR